MGPSTTQVERMGSCQIPSSKVRTAGWASASCSGKVKRAMVARSLGVGYTKNPPSPTWGSVRKPSPACILRVTGEVSAKMWRALSMGRVAMAAWMR